MTPTPDERDAWDASFNAALTGIMANPERWKQIADDYKTGKKTYDQCSQANVAKAANLADFAMAERRKRFPAEQEKPALEGEWIDWTGGECPVLPDEIVRVERRDGSTFAAPARLLRWQHLGWEDDVLRYRVVSP